MSGFDLVFRLFPGDEMWTVVKSAELGRCRSCWTDMVTGSLPQGKKHPAELNFFCSSAFYMKKNLKTS
jgi:hypothetical protein